MRFTAPDIIGCDAINSLLVVLAVVVDISGPDACTDFDMLRDGAPSIGVVEDSKSLPDVLSTLPRIVSIDAARLITKSVPALTAVRAPAIAAIDDWITTKTDFVTAPENCEVAVNALPMDLLTVPVKVDELAIDLPTCQLVAAPIGEDAALTVLPPLLDTVPDIVDATADQALAEDFKIDAPNWDAPASPFADCFVIAALNPAPPATDFPACLSVLPAITAIDAVTLNV